MTGDSAQELARRLRAASKRRRWTAPEIRDLEDLIALAERGEESLALVGQWRVLHPKTWHIRQRRGSS